MRSLGVLGAALIAASTSLVLSVPAVSAPLLNQPNLASSVPSATETIQFRRGGGFRGHRGYHRHHGFRGGHHYGYRRGYGGGGAVLGGLAAGAIIGGAIAAGSANAAVGDSVAYCSQRFKSYDPASGTYLGYDGIRHSCP